MNILRLSTLSLAVAIAVLALAYANPSFAGKDKNCVPPEPIHPSCKDDGGGGDPPDPGPPPGCPGDFPAFAYTVEITDNRGRTERRDLYLSNSVGKCQMLIDSIPHSRKFRASYDDLDFHYDDDSGVYRIAYNYDDDEANIREPIARPNIRIMQFKTITNDAGETTIDDDYWPLEVHKLYRYSGDGSASGGIYGNDMLGNSLVFSVKYGYTLPDKPHPYTDWYYEIRVIENISDCIKNWGPEPDEQCAERVFATDVPDSRAIFPRWGLTTNRIYFDHCWWCDGVPSPALGILDRNEPGSPWSAPGAVSIEDVDGLGFGGGSPALYEYGGSIEVLNQLDVDGKLHFLEIGIQCTAASAIDNSCVWHKSAVPVMWFPSQRQAGKWTTHRAIDPQRPNPNLMYFDSGTNSIFEFDPDSAPDPDPEMGNPRVIIEGISDNVCFDPVD